MTNIKLPLSPKFLLATLRYQDPTFPFKDSFSVDSQKINQLLRTEEAQKDLHRTAWEFKTREGLRSTTSASHRDMQQSLQDSGMTLTEEEYQALTFAAMCTDGKSFTQVGLFQLSLISSFLLFTNAYNMSTSPITQGQKIVTKESDGSFSITCTSTAFDSQVFPELISDNTSYASYIFKLQKEKDGFQFSIDHKTYQFEISKEMYDVYIVPAIRKALAKPTITIADLFTIIPGLENPTLAREFIDKLATTHDPKLIRKANELIFLCYANNQEQLSRLQNDLAFTTPVSAIRKECDSFQIYLENAVLKDLENLAASVNRHLNKSTLISDSFRHNLANQLNSIQTAITFCKTHTHQEGRDYLNNPDIKKALAIQNASKAASKFKDHLTQLNALIQIRTVSIDDTAKGYINRTKVDAFAKAFATHKHIFEKSTDSPTKKFLQKIARILAAIFTLGIYAKKRADKLGVSTPYFFKSRREIFTSITQHETGLKPKF